MIVLDLDNDAVRFKLGLWLLNSPATQKLNLDYWPIWAKTLKQLSTPKDKGIGDVVVRVIGEPASDAFKTWYKTTFGKDCNCTGRQAKWNGMYPLK